jgi:hypothetical protein
LSPAPRREDDADVRERLARLEAGAEGHERASAERHTLVLAAISDLRARLEKAEERSWKVLAAVAVLAAGGGVGGAELAKVILGGG